MQFFATHYWQPDNGGSTALVLQQVYHKRRRMPMLLMCIESNMQRERALASKLSDWFCGTALTLCARMGENGKESIVGSLRGVLEKQIDNAAGEEEYQFAGIMCMGEFCVLFQWRNQKIYLLNSKNQRPHMQDLEIGTVKQEGLCVQTGIIQPGIGILVGTKGFLDAIPHTMLEECLYVRELGTQKRVETRLKELGDFANRQSETHVAAALLVVR